MSVSNEENLLSRWSRRKRQTDEQSLLEDQLISARSSSPSEHEVKTALGGSEEESSRSTLEPEILTDADMPPLESLNENSDFSVFMSSGVSDQLRNLALRKLFQAPSFNIQDGLDDYAEDYTSFEKLGDIITCDMKHQVEMEAKKKLEHEAEKLMREEQAADAIQVDDANELKSAELITAEAEESSEITPPETTRKAETIHE